MNCPQCDIKLEATSSGSYKGRTWYQYECPVCDYCCTDEPDWDIMSEREVNNLD